MHEYQQVCNQRLDLPSLELGAVTVDSGGSAYNPRSPRLGVTYCYKEQSMLRKAAKLGDQCEGACGFCSRMKCGLAYAATPSNSYTPIDPGQSLDNLLGSRLLMYFALPPHAHLGLRPVFAFLGFEIIWIDPTSLHLPMLHCVSV
ncbi:hypothetical protein AAHC03_025834 [Spirometra sp. Aus1]